MDVHFEHLRVTRNNLLGIMDRLDPDRLNEIPEGFSNNIIWHAGHVITTHQGLIYRLSGLEGYLEKDFTDRYRKGTKPGRFIEQDEIKFIKANMLSLVNRIEKDYSSALFTSFREYRTSYNITLRTVEDAIIFNNIHESLHLGYVMALKKSFKA